MARRKASLRLRKRIKLLPGVYVNLSKSGASLSVGPPGATLNVGPQGARVTGGIPGTGISVTQRLSPGAAPAGAAPAPQAVSAVLTPEVVEMLRARHGVWPPPYDLNAVGDRRITLRHAAGLLLLAPVGYVLLWRRGYSWRSRLYCGIWMMAWLAQVPAMVGR